MLTLYFRPYINPISSYVYWRGSTGRKHTELLSAGLVANRGSHLDGCGHAIIRKARPP